MLLLTRVQAPDGAPSVGVNELSRRGRRLGRFQTIFLLVMLASGVSEGQVMALSNLM